MFLPIDKDDLRKRGWKKLDIILISGDAYVDHPSFGTAVIGRTLEAHNLKVGIISQPEWKGNEDFLRLGRPRLYFGITAGNMDSMINIYTARRKLRSNDAYSPGGSAGLRPRRSTIVYTQKVRENFGDIPVVIGGIEASLRRIPHYDHWSDKIRNSILFDSKADILAYGMAEKQVVEIAERLRAGESISRIDDVKGTVVKVKEIDAEKDISILPEFSSNISKTEFRIMSAQFEKDHQQKTIYQKFSNRYLKHNIPADPLSIKEIDAVYDLPFEREQHPVYKKKVPAFEQIRNSVTIHRGCAGGCNFCAIGKHQGKQIQSRSERSILEEIEKISQKEYFKGTISDIGGPTANMYGMECTSKKACNRNSCLSPEICSHFDSSHHRLKSLLQKITKQHQRKKVFIASGIRHDLALLDHDFIRLLVLNFVGGLLKLAPEHKNKAVLRLMNKPLFSRYKEFVHLFRKFSKNKKQYLVPYLIAGHPGESLEETLELAIYLKKNNVKLKQVQEFIPTPMTTSTMMYYLEEDLNGNTIHISRGREMKLQKALIQWFIPVNKKYVVEALRKLNRTDLLNFFLKKDLMKKQIN